MNASFRISSTDGILLFKSKTTSSNVLVVFAESAVELVYELELLYWGKVYERRGKIPSLSVKIALK